MEGRMTTAKDRKGSVQIINPVTRVKGKTKKPPER